MPRAPLMKPLLLSGFEPGGQLMVTTDVENYPGFAKPIQGPWLMEQMQAQAEHVGARIESEWVVAIELKEPSVHHPLRQRPHDRRGCDHPGDRRQGQVAGPAQSEHAFKGFGVSACATCDGFFFRGKSVIVVGGGNSAVEEALYLSNIASKVTVVHRRGSFRAEKILSDA